MPNRVTLPAQRSNGGPKVQSQAARQGGAAVQLDPAQLARATEMVLERRRSASVRTDDRTNRYTVRDIESLARDNGVSDRDMDSRHEAQDRGARVLRDASQGIRRDDEGRVARPSFGGRKRQFHEMNGRRSLGAPDLTNLGDIGLRFSSYLGYMAATHGDSRAAWQWAKDEKADATVVRALGESTIAGGGALVPVDMQEDYIELLYNASAYLQGNPVRMDAPNGNLEIPKITGGATGGWLGENANAAASAQTFGSVRASLKYIYVVVPISNRLLAHSPANAEGIIRDDLINEASRLIDTAAIRGTGTAHQPLGMKNRVASGNTTTANATVNVANVTVDTTKMQRWLENAKIKFIRPYWMFAPRSRWYLMGARDGNNNLVWAAEMAGGKFWGKPFGVTANIPINLGGGSDSEVYLADMVHQVFAEGVGADGLEVSAVNGAAYHDGSAVISGFSQDQTVVKLKQSCDIVSRQDGNEIAMLSAVTWGV